MNEDLMDKIATTTIPERANMLNLCIYNECMSDGAAINDIDIVKLDVEVRMCYM